MNDIQHKEILNNMDKLYEKLDLAEERLSKLEKEPHAKHCESCGKTTFEEFVPYRFPPNTTDPSDKVFEMCPSCASAEYRFEEKMLDEKRYKSGMKNM